MLVPMKSSLAVTAASVWKQTDPVAVGTLAIVVACLGVLATLLQPG